MENKNSNNAPRRNIVTILSDSLRADFLNAYGADFIPTPNIDSLCENGVIFDNAITASTVCGPARGAIITGSHVSTHDAWTNEMPFRDRIELLPERLNEAGYMTAAVGIMDHPTEENPLGLQFVNRTDLGDLEKAYLKELKEKHPEVKSYYNPDGYSFLYPEEDYYDYYACDKAIDFINTYSQTGKAPNGKSASSEGAPFFLFCGFLSPHAPYTPPKEVSGTVDINKIPTPLLTTDDKDEQCSVAVNRRAFLNTIDEINNPAGAIEERMKLRLAYCEMVVEVDRLVGRIISALKENGIYENTTIIFTADHGSNENDHNLSTKGPWPHKPQLFIPLVVSNHPNIKPGTRCDCLCGNLDIGATCLEIAGDNKMFGLSRSLIGLANGTVPDREVNLSEFCDSSKTLVDKRYTFIYYPFVQERFLIDRLADPEERVNLSGKPEYAQIENKFLMHLIDYAAINKGIRIEAHDMIHPVREAIQKKSPKFLEEFEICYPLATMDAIQHLKDAGLPWDYNEFCKDYPIKAHYGVYFQDENN